MKKINHIGVAEQITQLKDIGINLLEYLPKNMYICSIDKYILPTQLEKFNVISLNKILPSFKIDKKLKNNYEVISYKDYVFYGNEIKCKENGKLRIEGKDYIVKDGDIMHFRFNV